MKLSLPDIPASERTPLVLLLLDIIHQQQQQIAQLQDEIARLKGLKPSRWACKFFCVSWAGNGVCCSVLAALW
jgi:hypothetical protein